MYKNLFFSRVISNVVKNRFHEFWSIFGHSTVPSPKFQKTSEIGPWKKFSHRNPEKRTFFFFRWAINLSNMSITSICLSNNVSCPQTHRKIFYGHWTHIRDMNFRFLKKKTFLQKSVRGWNPCRFEAKVEKTSLTWFFDDFGQKERGHCKSPEAFK